MDVLRQARGMLLNLQGGHNIVHYLHPDVRFHGPMGDLGRQELLDLLQRRRGRFTPAEPEMRRNLVWVSWERADGDEVRSGTWFLSFDREGLVREWTEIHSDAPG